MNPLIEEENRLERLHRSQDRVLLDEDIRKQQRKESKMSYAQKLQEYGDYLPEDSGMNNGDRE